MNDIITLAIDFGTTRTKVAHFDSVRSEPRLIELGQENRNVIPSVFFIPLQNGGSLLVGDDAVQMIGHEPQGVVLGLKRTIHEKSQILCGPGRAAQSRIELASSLFQYIRTRCEQSVFHAPLVKSCRLTVPVAFAETKRQCIRRAAELGGFTGRIELIDEPVAAARAWLAGSGGSIDRHIVVCDIGGGTTDFALLQRERNRLEPYPDVPPTGFPLGGDDVDKGILDWLLAHDQIQKAEIECRRNEYLFKLRHTKELLSRDDSREEHKLSIAGQFIVVPRTAVKLAAEELLTRVRNELGHFLAKCESATKCSTIPVLLVGGGSRINGLKQAVDSVAPNRILEWNHSEYATVMGAVEYPELGGVARRSVADVQKAETATAISAYRDELKRILASGKTKMVDLKNLIPLSERLSLDKATTAQLEIEVFKGKTKEHLIVRAKQKQARRRLEELGAVQNQPPSPEAQEHYQQALMLRENANETAALGQARAASSYAPNWAEPRFLEGNLLQLRDPKLAIAAFTDCLRICPARPDALAARAWCHFSLSAWSAAREDFNAAIAKSPESLDWQLLAGRAATFAREGKDKDAIPDLNCAIESTTDPAFRSALYCVLSKLLERSAASSLDSSLRSWEQLLIAPKDQIESAFVWSLDVFGFPTGLLIRLNVLHQIWNAVSRKHQGCSFDAVREFNKYVTPSVEETLDVILLGDGLNDGGAEFCFKQIVVAAEDSQLWRATLWAELLARQCPAFDIRELLKRDAVKAAMRNYERLSHALRPRLVFEESHGSVFNSVTVKNDGPFDAHRVGATIREVRTAQSPATKPPSILPFGILKAGASHVWNEVFDNPGWFGGNIKQVEIELDCEEWSIVQQHICSQPPPPPEKIPVDRQSVRVGNENPKCNSSLEQSRWSSSKQAGDVCELSVGAIDIAFRWCPPGKFTIGSPLYQISRKDNEDQVQVELTTGFWMQETVVTQAMWTAVMNSQPWLGQDKAYNWETFPATCVNWDDATEFCHRLTAAAKQASVLTTGQIELPTEARWEYACRAGTTMAYSFGNDSHKLDEYAWFDGNTNREKYAHEVGRKQANPWGLWDMHGNVWEWCQDAYNRKLIGGRDPVAVSGVARVLRGGAWNDLRKNARCSSRNFSNPFNRYCDIGFRVMAEL